MYSYYKFIWRYFTTKDKIFFACTAVLSIGANGISVILPVMQKTMIDKITIHEQSFIGVIVLCIVSILGIAAILSNAIIINSLLYRIERNLQLRLLSSAMTGQNKIIKSKGPGAYMVSVFGDSEQMAMLIDNNVFDLLMQMIASVTILVVSLRWSPLFVCVIIPAYIGLILNEIISSKLFRSNFEKGREAVYEINPRVLEMIENRDTLLGYASVDHFMMSLNKQFDGRDLYFKRAGKIERVSEGIIGAIKTATMVAFFIFSLYYIGNNKMEVSSFVALTTCFSYVFSPITTLKKCVTGSQKYKTLRDKLDASLLDDKKTGIPRNSDFDINHCSCKYNEVDYSLKNLTMTFNGITGIVGLSGEGKTSIIKMMLGEIAPEEGKCLMGGVKTEDIPKPLIRSVIRYLKQDEEIFDEDLKYNIVLNKKGISKIEYDEILNKIYLELRSLRECRDDNEAMKKKHATECVVELFGVYELGENRKKKITEYMQIIKNMDADQLLFLAGLYASKEYYVESKYIEIIHDLNLTKLEGRRLGQRGNKISGGEKNKIILARFLIMENQQFFIIDEPFTNVDTISETTCMNVLKKYLKGSQGIIISHKLNIIKELSNKICVLSEGMIVMEGEHEYLLDHSSLYKSLYESFLKKAELLD